MKKMVSFLLAFLLLTASAGAVDLYVDMTKIETDTPPAVVDGRTLVPLRAIFEAVGSVVEWDQPSRTAIGTKDDTTVMIQIDNPTAYVNGEPHTLDVPAQLIHGRTMVPARFISESLGCDVTWYQPTQTAAVANTLKGQHIYVTETGEKYHYSGSCNGGVYYEATLAEAVGRGLTPCDKCVLTGSSAPSAQPAAPVPTAPSVPAETAPSVQAPSNGGGTGDASNFNTYDNEAQQQTSETYVLNTKSKKIHRPSCSQVKKISPKNYATSSASKDTLLAQGYTVCKVCHK